MNAFQKCLWSILILIFSLSTRSLAQKPPSETGKHARTQIYNEKIREGRKQRNDELVKMDVNSKTQQFSNAGTYRRLKDKVSPERKYIVRKKKIKNIKTNKKLKHTKAEKH